MPADIDETPFKAEMPRDYALRMAREKALKVLDVLPAERREDSVILAADTVVACGRRILPKAENEAQARDCLELLSGRRHHVYGGIAVLDAENGALRTRLCDTVVQFKRLSSGELEVYLEAGEWDGKAGGYAIQGYAGAFVKFIRGSYSNVVGLSLYDTMALLRPLS